MKFYRNKNILITGGAGFIGSHLAKRLVGYGARIHILDNLSSGTLSNLSEVQNAVTFIHDDIRSKAACKTAAQNCDVVFHCAALVSVPLSVENQGLCNEINVEGTRNILEAAVHTQARHVVFSSSAAVYGDRSSLCHEHDTVRPLSPYAKSKVLGEKLCAHFAQKSALCTTALRYFNVHGDGQASNGNYTAVMSTFKTQLSQHKPLTIFGDGMQTRDFVSIDHVVDSNLLVGASKRACGEIFNIASGKSITLLELARTLEKEMGAPAKEIIFKPARQGDIRHSAASCTKYQKFASDIDNFALD